MATNNSDSHILRNPSIKQDHQIFTHITHQKEHVNN